MNDSNRRALIALCIFVLLTITCNVGSFSLSWDATRTPTPGKATPGAPTFPTPLPAFERINLVAEENGGRIVSATGEDPDYPASNLIDGYTGDYAEWWVEPTAFPQTIVFAFDGDQVKNINQVVLNSWVSDWRSCRVKDFEIWVSTSSPRFSDMKQVGGFTLDQLGVDQSFTFDAVKAKYVALVIKSSYGGEAGITLNEFQVYEAPPNAKVTKPGNLAAKQNGGRIVAFSSEDSSGDWPAAHLIDGANNTSEGWSSADTEKSPYVVFTFKGDKPRRIDRVILNPYSAKYQEDWIKDFELRVSETTTDPKLMQSVGRFRLEKIGKDQQFTFAPVRARYLALVPLTNYGGTAFALNEFEVYDAPPVAASSTQPQALTSNGGAVSNFSPTSAPESKGVPGDLSRALAPAAPVDRIGVEVTLWEIVPSVYHLYGAFFDSMAIVTLTNENTTPVKVRVEATVPNYTETAIKTVTLEPDDELTIELNPPLIPGVMERLTEAKSASLHLKVEYLKEGERRLIYEETTPTKVWSQGDVLLEDPRFHNPFIFEATLVTPADPALDRILRNATQYAPGGIISGGYGEEGDKGGKVYNTLKAIYKAVADDGVIYVNAGIPFLSLEEKAQGYYLQRIKLPYQVLATHSGMCIETSLLFASLYEKIGLDPVIIRMPGHAFLAVPVNEDSATYYFIETTLVGRDSFEAAINSGAKKFNEIYPQLRKDRHDLYYWLNISAMRAEGILPIPWR